MTEPVKDGVYFDYPEADYHLAPALGSTNHRQLLRSGPDFWWNSWMNAARPVEDDDSHAKIVGRAMHACVLDGRATFLDRYAPTFAPGNRKDGIEERKVIAAAGKIALKFDDYQRILAADALIKANQSIAGAFTGGHHEVSVFWTTSDGVPCKARFDYLKPFAIVDLKSIRNMRETEFVDACRRRIADYRYDIQAAHYMEARAVMPSLPVFGYAGDAAWLERVMTAPEYAFTIIFFQGDDAPISWGCSMSPKNPILEIARRSISAARWRYTQYLEQFGTSNAWVLSEPLAELSLDEMPKWFGQK